MMTQPFPEPFPFIAAGSAVLGAQVVQLQFTEDDHEAADQPGHAVC